MPEWIQSIILGTIFVLEGLQHPPMTEADLETGYFGQRGEGAAAQHTVLFREIMVLAWTSERWRGDSDGIYAVKDPRRNPLAWRATAVDSD